MAEGARVAALHLIHAQASRDIRRRIEGELLRSLLDGKDATGSTAAQLGLDPRAPIALIALGLANADDAMGNLHRIKRGVSGRRRSPASLEG